MDELNDISASIFKELENNETDLTRVLEQVCMLDNLVKDQTNLILSEEERIKLLKASNSLLLSLTEKVRLQQKQLKKELILLSDRKNANKQYLDKG